MEKREKEVGWLGFHTLSLYGNFRFILEFLLDFFKDNLVISMVESLIPYQRPILPYFGGIMLSI